MTQMGSRARKTPDLAAAQEVRDGLKQIFGLSSGQEVTKLLSPDGVRKSKLVASEYLKLLKNEDSQKAPDSATAANYQRLEGLLAKNFKLILDTAFRADADKVRTSYLGALDEMLRLTEGATDQNRIAITTLKLAVEICDKDKLKAIITANTFSAEEPQGAAAFVAACILEGIPA